MPDVFAQVWHERGGDCQLEHRESRERFVAAAVPDAAAVTGALVGWARQRGGWDGGFAWSPVETDPPREVPELAPTVRAEVERRVVCCCGAGTTTGWRSPRPPRSIWSTATTGPSPPRRPGSWSTGCG